MRYILVAGCLSLISTFSVAQSQAISWDNDMCSFNAKFDSKKFTRQEVLNTVRFIENPYPFAIPNTPAIEQDFSKYQVDAAFKQEYLDLKRDVQQTKLVNLPIFQQLKENSLRNLDISYDIMLRVSESYRDPSRLATPTYGQKCLAIAKQRSNVDSKQLISAWHTSVQQKIIEQNKLGNTSYAALAQQRFQQEMNSRHALNYAKQQLTDDWQNCAVDYLPSNQQDETTDWYNILNKQIFNGSLKEQCDV